MNGKLMVILNDCRGGDVHGTGDRRSAVGLRFGPSGSPEDLTDRSDCGRDFRSDGGHHAQFWNFPDCSSPRRNRV